jgi:hypothetical protein
MMKWLLFIFSLGVLTGLASCGGGKGKQVAMTAEDSARVSYVKAFRVRVAALQKVREDISGPEESGEDKVLPDDRSKSLLSDDSISTIIAGFQKLQDRISDAQKDSSTYYGILFTRFKLIDGEHKYLTATYDQNAHLLRYTEQLTIDDRHEEERDFYFDAGQLTYYRSIIKFPHEEQDEVNDDSYFLVGRQVVYAYRNQGSAPDKKDKMNVIPTRKFLLTGNLTVHVSKEFESFRRDYEILLKQPLEPLLYTQ